MQRPGSSSAPRNVAHVEAATRVGMRPGPTSAPLTVPYTALAARIVVVSDDTAARAQLVEALAGDSREVVAVTLEGAVANIRERGPALVVVVAPRDGAPAYVRALLAADSTHLLYVVTIVDETQPRALIRSLFAAGSQDVLCAPYCLDELHARVDLRRRPPLADAHPAANLRAWQYLGELVHDELEIMLARPLALRDGWAGARAAVPLATIAMTLPVAHLDLCVSIIADAPARDWLARHLLGGPTADELAIDDTLREVTNVAGAALKRAAAGEGAILSTGIPITTTTPPRRDAGARFWTLPLEGTAALIVAGELRLRANRKVPAQRLAEGMVVVSDVRTSAGVLLLPSGTLLTATTAHRLGAMLAATLIDVAV